MQNRSHAHSLYSRVLCDDRLAQSPQPRRVDETSDRVQVDRLIDRPHLRPAGGDQRLHFVQTTAPRRRRGCHTCSWRYLRQIQVDICAKSSFVSLIFMFHRTRVVVK